MIQKIKGMAVAAVVAAVGLCGSLWGEQIEEGDFRLDTETGEIVRYIGTADEVTIPDAIAGMPVKSIGASAFVEKTLRSVTIPATVTNIGENAFYACSLSHVTFAADGKLERIGSRAFSNNALSEVTIPESVVNICEGAFFNAAEDVTVQFLSSQPPQMGKDVFYVLGMKAIYVPIGSKEAYMTAESWAPYVKAVIAALPGAPKRPWEIGQPNPRSVLAYTNGVGRMVICGSGAPMAFEPGAAPWSAVEPSINEIVVPQGRGEEYRSLWPELAEKITDTADMKTVEYYRFENGELVGPFSAEARGVTADLPVLDTGWYAVEKSVLHVANGIRIDGDVKLILQDEAELVVTGFCTHAGIEVADADGYTTSLAIYGGAKQTGSLKAVATCRGAGIGGGHLGRCGSVTICGGRVTAEGHGEYSTGIGDGNGEGGCIVTIEGGTVTATGEGGAGIGSGSSETKGEHLRDGAVVVIRGGTVTAVGKGGGAGLGGGQYCGTGMVWVEGGTVTATSEGGGAGIGSALLGKGWNIVINGGTVTATGLGGAGIGSGVMGDACDIRVNGGEVTATAGAYEGVYQGEAIGAGMEGQGGTKLDLNGYTSKPFFIYAGNDTTGTEVEEVQKEDYASAWHASTYVQITKTRREMPTEMVVKLPAVEHAAFAVFTNGVALADLDGRTAQTLTFADFPEVKVVYTADEGYLLGEKLTWTKFIDSVDLESRSRFTLTPPAAVVGTLPAECVEKLGCVVVGETIGEWTEYGPVCTYSMSLPDETAVPGESYFWVAFRRIEGSELTEEQRQLINQRRIVLEREVLPGLIGNAVGKFEQFKAHSVYAEFENAEGDYYAASGKVGSLAELPVELPQDTETVYVFRVRPGENGDSDAKIDAIGRCAGIFGAGRWSNSLYGETETLSYYAWDEAQGKLVQQPPVTATVLRAPESGLDVVLHAGEWYVAVDRVNYWAGLRVGAGTAHLILADGASWIFNCGATVADSAKLAVYSQSETSANPSGDAPSLSINDTQYDEEAHGGLAAALSGGSLEIHGGDISIYGQRSQALRNRETVVYGGRVYPHCSAAVEGAVSCRLFDLRGGRFVASAEDENYNDIYPQVVIAGEQDGVACVMKVAKGMFVELCHYGLNGFDAAKTGYTAIGDSLEIRLADGVYSWMQIKEMPPQFTTIPHYRLHPKQLLCFNSSDECLHELHFSVSAHYDEGAKTNAFTLTLPQETLHSGEKFVVMGFDEELARMFAEDYGMTACEAYKIELAAAVGAGATVVGDDLFAGEILESGLDGYPPVFTTLTDTATVEIPSADAVDMVLVMRVLDTPDKPVVSMGLETELQSLADAETVVSRFEYLTKQEFSVERNSSGGFTVTMPEGDVLQPDERWSWAAMPAGLGDDPEMVEMIKMQFGSGMPVGILSFDEIAEEEEMVIAAGDTTDGSFEIPAETAAVIVSKTRPGVCAEEGPCERLMLKVGMASCLNVDEYAAWPRHDEIFPPEEYCTVTLPAEDKAAFFVVVDGEELGYEPDGVYSVRKGSEVQVRVELFDKEHYELRSPECYTYSNIQGDITVKAEDIVIAERSGDTEIADQSFVVRCGEDGALTLDLSAAGALGTGEMWAYVTLDKSACSQVAASTHSSSFGDAYWSYLRDMAMNGRAGKATFDNFLTLAGAESMGVTTETSVSLPRETEIVAVGRVYDRFDGQLGSPRYYAVALGGARYLSALQPGASVNGEHWHDVRAVRYSAWDAEQTKVVHGFTANAKPLTPDCFDQVTPTGAGPYRTLKVTADSFYVTSGLRWDKEPRMIDVAPGVTLSIIVEDGLSVALNRIHLPPTATLNVYGQDAGTGNLSLLVEEAAAETAIGGDSGEGCGAINVHGGYVGVHVCNDSSSSMSAAVGSGTTASVGGSLTVYGGRVDIECDGSEFIAIGGEMPMAVNVVGGKLMVGNGRIGAKDRRLDTGLNLGPGYRLMDATDPDNRVEMSVDDYNVKQQAKKEPLKIDIVRRATVTFDDQIVALVNEGTLMVVAECGSGGWAEVSAKTLDVDCGESVLVAFAASTQLKAPPTFRTPDVMRFPRVSGDIEVTIDELRMHEPELVSEQPFEVKRGADGRFSVTAQGELADGEAWLWVTLPAEVATLEVSPGVTLEDGLAGSVQQLIASQQFYVGGSGGKVTLQTGRALLNFIRQGLLPQTPFLPTDGFHWGVSREKSVFSAPADTDAVALFKVYDAGSGRMVLSDVKKEESSKKVMKAALAAKSSSTSGTDVLEVMMGVMSRYAWIAAGSKTHLQAVPPGPDLKPGDIGNPWMIGPDGAVEPIAYTNDTQTLVIAGEGAFAQPTLKPWLEDGVGPITEIVIKNPQAGLPEDIFAGLGTVENPLSIILPDGWQGDLPVDGEPWHGGYVKIDSGHWPFMIRNVRFQQRYPWNGLVDITFDLAGSTNVELRVSATDGERTVAASNFVGRTDLKFVIDGQETVKLLWDADTDCLVEGLTKIVCEKAKLAVGTDNGLVSAESEEELVDLSKGARVARDLERILVDPAWGAASEASVLWPKAETPKTYAAATVDMWDTARLPAGQYEFAYTAGSTAYTAEFWVPANNWAVIDHETINGERHVSGEKVLVVGETVIVPGGKLFIDGDPAIVGDGAFKVEEGGKIFAPGFDVSVDPETGLVTLEPKARPTVTGLRFAQRYPWNGLVDVYFTVINPDDPAAKIWVKLAAKLNGEEKSVTTLYVAADPSATNTQFHVEQGEVHLVWDTMKDIGPENFGSLEITAKAAYARMAEEGSDDPKKEDDDPKEKDVPEKKK